MPISTRGIVRLNVEHTIIDSVVTRGGDAGIDFLSECFQSQCATLFRAGSGAIFLAGSPVEAGVGAIVFSRRGGTFEGHHDFRELATLSVLDEVFEVEI